jgi:hypothetical protein
MTIEAICRPIAAGYLKGPHCAGPLAFEGAHPPFNWEQVLLSAFCLSAEGTRRRIIALFRQTCANDFKAV